MFVFTAFNGFRLLVAQTETSLEHVRKLASAHGNITRVKSERVPFTMFTFIGEAPMLRSVTTCDSSGWYSIVAILESERIYVDYRRLFSGQLNRLTYIINTFRLQAAINTFVASVD